MRTKRLKIRLYERVIWSPLYAVRVQIAKNGRILKVLLPKENPGLEAVLVGMNVNEFKKREGWSVLI
jgi:hypothetical protein